MAKEFDVPFVCLAQINRGVEGQTNERLRIADIKDQFREKSHKFHLY
jgi:replicative DNA helicase